jgi:photosystem II stability/assembly factor-like uncharacterized protein
MAFFTVASFLQSQAQYHLDVLRKGETKNFNEIVRQVEEYYKTHDKGKGSGYKQFKRWEDFYKNRLSPEGNILNIAAIQWEDYLNRKAKQSNLRVMPGSPASNLGNWTNLGPESNTQSSWMGRVTSVSFDPADSNIIYAGTPGGGLWRSFNHGATWRCITDQIPATLGVASVAIDPSSPVSNRTIYIVTGDPDAGKIFSIGVLKSTDNGNTWNATGLTFGSTTGTLSYKVALHPSNPQIIFVATNFGLYKSSDGGTTWTVKSGGDIMDFEFKPNNPATMYLVSSNGVYKSINSGDTWTKNSFVFPASSRRLLAVTPANPSYLYVGLSAPAGPGKFAGLFRSTDDGNTFSLRGNSPDVIGGQYVYNFGMAASPINAEEIFIAGLTGYKSTDGGSTFTHLNNLNTHIDWHSLIFNKNTLYATTDGGVHYTSTGDGPFTDISSGLVITEVYRIGGDLNNENIILNGSQDNGNSSLSNKINTILAAGDGGECMVDPINPNIWYHSWTGGTILKYENGSNDIIFSPDASMGSGPFVTDFVLDPINNKIFYIAGFKDLYKREDWGSGNIQVTNLTNGKTGTVPCNQVMVNPTNPKHILILKIFSESIIYKTLDGGATWSALKFPFAGVLNSLTKDPDNFDIIYGTGRGRESGKKVFKSTDGGTTWINISGSMPNIMINCIVSQKGSTNGLYIGTDEGIYYRDDVLGDWVLFSKNLPYTIINELEIHDKSGKIRAGTFGRGVWESPLYKASTNISPVVTITSPSNGQSFTAPLNISITANASDSDGSIAKVEFYQGSTKLGEDLTSPYSFSWNNPSSGSYALTAKAFDNGGAFSSSAIVNITVTGGVCTASGTILREQWNNIPGMAVSAIPVTTSPSSTSQLSLFEGPENMGDNYGSRIRGYVCAPATGNYIFWIASNDQSELWLSTDDNPANKKKIAFISSYTNSREWTKMASQKSVAINLTAGKRYYIEALQKEELRSDHLAVGWQLPNGTLERPIPGNRLSPFGGSTNIPPAVSITSPANNASFSAPASITINANASDPDGSISKVEFYQGTTKLAEDLTTPYSFSWTNVQAGSYSLIVKAYDNVGAITSSSTINVTVTGGTGDNCTASGTILREYWANTTGGSLAGVPFNNPPTNTSQLSIFEGPMNAGANYGSRIRGYICAPATGAYTFWIASNDNSELWLSTNDNPSSKVKIASVTGYTSSRQWDKYTSQKSAAINLIGGSKYYIEAIHIQNGGTDNIAVGWQLPNATFERPIGGNRLTPFTGTTNNSPSVSIIHPVNNQNFNLSSGGTTITATASDPDGTISKVEFYEGTTKLGEDLSPNSQGSYEYDQFTFSSSGDYTFTAKAYDNQGSSKVSPSVAIHVSATQLCEGSGTVFQEFWKNISGTAVSSIPVNTSPTEVKKLQGNTFEGMVNYGDNYGSRIKAYICPPVSGNYIFWIACNDNGELWLSTNDNPANKRKIAYVSSYTNANEWGKLATQKSASIALVSGTKYYIEVLQKEGSNSDHVSVGWQYPNGSLERPILLTRLIAINDSNKLPLVAITTPQEGDAFNAPTNVRFEVNASDPDGIINRVDLMGLYGGLYDRDYESPYVLIGEFASGENGETKLIARAFDDAGGFSDDTITLILNNTSEEFSSASRMSNELDVLVYPNPTAKEKITVAVEGYDGTKHKVIIDIHDKEGKNVYSHKTACDITCSRTVINLDERFQSGTYIVNVKLDKKSFSQRVIIE